MQNKIISINTGLTFCAKNLDKIGIKSTQKIDKYLEKYSDKYSENIQENIQNMQTNVQICPAYCLQISKENS